MSLFGKTQFDQGSTVSISAALTIAGTPIDASTVTLKIKTPGGVVTVHAFDHDGEGLYSADVECDLPGKWWYRWESIAPQAAQEGHFIISDSHVLARVS